MFASMICPRSDAGQVNSWVDDVYLSDHNESSLALAEEYCGPTATSDTTCTLRTAFLYASALVGSDVEILVNATDLILEQRARIEVSGYVVDQG